MSFGRVIEVPSKGSESAFSGRFSKKSVVKQKAIAAFTIKKKKRGGGVGG